jgi:hypothetical protein
MVSPGSSRHPRSHRDDWFRPLPPRWRSFATVFSSDAILVATRRLFSANSTRISFISDTDCSGTLAHGDDAYSGVATRTCVRNSVRCDGVGLSHSRPLLNIDSKSMATIWLVPWTDRGARSGRDGAGKRTRGQPNSTVSGWGRRILGLDGCASDCAAEHPKLVQIDVGLWKSILAIRQ